MTTDFNAPLPPPLNGGDPLSQVNGASDAGKTPEAGTTQPGTVSVGDSGLERGVTEIKPNEALGSPAVVSTATKANGLQKGIRPDEKATKMLNSLGQNIEGNQHRPTPSGNLRIKQSQQLPKGMRKLPIGTKPKGGLSKSAPSARPPAPPAPTQGLTHSAPGRPQKPPKPTTRPEVSPKTQHVAKLKQSAPAGPKGSLLKSAPGKLQKPPKPASRPQVSPKTEQLIAARSGATDKPSSASAKAPKSPPPRSSPPKPPTPPPLNQSAPPTLTSAKGKLESAALPPPIAKDTNVEQKANKQSQPAELKGSGASQKRLQQTRSKKSLSLMNPAERTKHLNQAGGSLDLSLDEARGVELARIPEKITSDSKVATASIKEDSPVGQAASGHILDAVKHHATEAKQEIGDRQAWKIGAAYVSRDTSTGELMNEMADCISKDYSEQDIPQMRNMLSFARGWVEAPGNRPNLLRPGNKVAAKKLIDSAIRHPNLEIRNKGLELEASYKRSVNTASHLESLKPSPPPKTKEAPIDMSGVRNGSVKPKAAGIALARTMNRSFATTFADTKNEDWQSAGRADGSKKDSSVKGYIANANNTKSFISKEILSCKSEKELKQVTKCLSETIHQLEKTHNHEALMTIHSTLATFPMARHLPAMEALGGKSYKQAIAILEDLGQLTNNKAPLRASLAANPNALPSVANVYAPDITLLDAAGLNKKMTNAMTADSNTTKTEDPAPQLYAADRLFVLGNISLDAGHRREAALRNLGTEDYNEGEAWNFQEGIDQSSNVTEDDLVAMRNSEATKEGNVVTLFGKEYTT